MPDPRPRLVGIADYMDSGLEVNDKHTKYICTGKHVPSKGTWPCVIQQIQSYEQHCTYKLTYDTHMNVTVKPTDIHMIYTKLWQC